MINPLDSAYSANEIKPSQLTVLTLLTSDLELNQLGSAYSPDNKPSK